MTDHRGRAGAPITLTTYYYLDGVLTDPFLVDTVDIYTAAVGGAPIISGLAVMRLSTGVYETTWTPASDLAAATYWDEWTITGRSGKVPKSYRHEIEVFGNMSNPYDWPSIEDAIYDWFFGSTGISTDWASQKRPNRDYPFATLKRTVGTSRIAFSDEINEETDLGQDVGQEVGLSAQGDREFMVYCQVRTGDDAPDLNANNYMEIAEARLQLPSIKQSFRDAGFSLVEAEPIRDLDEVIGTQWISGCSMDVRFRILSTFTERTGYIEKVEVGGTVKDVDDSTAYDYTEDIPQ